MARLLLRIGVGYELLVATPRRKLRKLKLDTSEVSGVRIWSLESERCLSGVRAGEIVDRARDTSIGEYVPTEAPSCLQKLIRAWCP